MSYFADYFVGQMRAEVLGPSGKIPVGVTVKERGKMNISFNPKIEGRTSFTTDTQQGLPIHSSLTSVDFYFRV